MSADIWDLERELNLCSGIVCLDNPRLTSVVVEFTETVRSEYSFDNNGELSTYYKKLCR